MRITRRDLIVGSSAGLSIALVPSKFNQHSEAKAKVFGADTYIHITPDNQLICVLSPAEMGQGVSTSFTTMIAEELRTSPQSFEMRFAQTSPYYNNPIFRNHLTGGSTTIAGFFDPVRQMAATARELLRLGAARIWDVSAQSCQIREKMAVHPESGRTLSFGEVVQLVKDWTADDLVKKADPTAPKDWLWIGRSVPRLDDPTKLRGQGVYGIDGGPPDALQAYVAYSPQIGGSLNGFDGDAVVRGAHTYQVLPLGSRGVAVVGKSWWQARTISKGLKISWKDGPLAQLSSRDILKEQRKRLNPRVAASVYELPYLPHSAMEPLSATVRLTQDRCDVWVGTQAPGFAKMMVQQVTGLPGSKIFVHSAEIGGSFGRRAGWDFILDAVELAKITNQTIKLIWDRETDFQRDLFRPSTMISIFAKVEPDGGLSNWHKRVVGAKPTNAQFDDAYDVMEEYAPQPMRAKVESIEANETVPYALGPSPTFEFSPYDPGVPTGFWRSVSHSYNCFAVESYIDELAHAHGRDPGLWRLDLMERKGTKASRIRNTLKLALDKVLWTTEQPDRWLGVACSECFGSAITVVAALSKHQSKVKLDALTLVLDCGLPVNPDGIRQQVEGSAIFALGALYQQKISIEKGQVQEASFRQCDPLRIFQTPKIKVHIVPSEGPPTGVGEVGVPAVAPAVTNAIFRATGDRIRSLPCPKEVLL